MIKNIHRILYKFTVSHSQNIQVNITKINHKLKNGYANETSTFDKTYIQIKILIQQENNPPRTYKFVKTSKKILKQFCLKFTDGIQIFNKIWANQFKKTLDKIKIKFIFCLKNYVIKLLR